MVLRHSASFHPERGTATTHPRLSLPGPGYDSAEQAARIVSVTGIGRIVAMPRIQKLIIVNNELRRKEGIKGGRECCTLRRDCGTIRGLHTTVAIVPIVLRVVRADLNPHRPLINIPMDIPRMPSLTIFPIQVLPHSIGHDFPCTEARVNEPYEDWDDNEPGQDERNDHGAVHVNPAMRIGLLVDLVHEAERLLKAQVFPGHEPRHDEASTLIA